MSVVLLIDVAGWFGALLVVGAYGALSAGRVREQDARYQWANVVGAVMLAAAALVHGAFPSVAVNVVWCVIGGAAVARARRRPSHPAGS